MADDIIYDEMLGELRTSDVSGGTGGGSSYVAGDGIAINGNTISATGGGGDISGEIADVTEIMTGVTGGTTAVVDVSGLRGALTAGQAVDVTSQPDNVTGDYRGTFSVTGSLGFADFPKFATGLNYLMIADLTATTNGTVTPSGTWLDGTTTAKSLAAGTSTRVAMLFDADNKGKFTFASTGSVEVSNCREYEVTSCSNEAIAYIASLSNPDSFLDYYLVKRDMVSPWTNIIDMGESPSTTVAAGLAYQIKALTGSHIITVDTCPSGYVGRETFVRIFVGQTGNVIVQSPLQLATPLVANAINNCTISYRDGSAVLTVDDTVGGYIVEAASGTTAGTLYYGLMDSATEFVSIPGAFDGIPVDLGGASVTTSGTAQKHVVGNGMSNTLISGNLNAGAGKLTLSNLSLADVGITGGTLTIPNGVVASGTVTISSGASAIFNGGAITSGGTMFQSSGGIIVVNTLNGSGGTIDLGGSSRSIASAGAQISGVTLTGGSFGSLVTGVISGTATAVNCVFTGNSGRYGCCAKAGAGGYIALSNCIVSGNTGDYKLYVVGGTMSFTGCTLNDNFGMQVGGSAVLVGSNRLTSIIGRGLGSGGSGCIVIADGAIMDLSGNTNATPLQAGSAGSITYGSNVTIINSAGSSVLLNGGTAGTCMQIAKDGTIS